MSERWTTHCPRCSSAVQIAGHPAEVACTSCGDRFPPEGLPTARMRRGAPDPVDPDDPMVGQRLGRWRIQRLLGRGGMGRVYEATDRFRRRHVALKVLREDLAKDEAFRRRFDRESQTLADLTHPHIVRVVDSGDEDGRLWFAMDYVRGESLRRRLERGPLPAAEAVAIATQMTSALAYAHSHGVVHRDLKPENVLLGEDGTARLVDFGLSKWHGERAAVAAATRLTHTDVIMGTYEYMAPEQRRSDTEVGPPADIFALGVILYEMLTGTLPLGRFQLPSEHSVDVSRRLDTIVTKALAPDPRHRYASAEVLYEDLENALRGGPEPAAPAPAADSAAVPVVDDGPVHRHVEILSALDRVLGIVALLAAMGSLTLVEVLAPVRLSAAPLAFLRSGSVVLIVVGILLLRQGGRLARMTEGSRQAQVTTSLILLLFPPFLTGMGIYGLWALTSERARAAFDRRRPRIGGALPRPGAAPLHPVPAHVVPPVAIASSTRHVGFPTLAQRSGPSLLLRLFLLGSILWAAHTALVALDILAFDSHTWNTFHVKDWLKGSVIASVVGAGWMAVLVAHRHERRGWGLALIALLLLLISTSFLVACYQELGTVGTIVPRFGALPPASPLPGALAIAA